jgi:hypothetical protein
VGQVYRDLIDIFNLNFSCDTLPFLLRLLFGPKILCSYLVVEAIGKNYFAA